MFRAIIFDVDGVLLDSFEANLKFFQDLMTAAGYPLPTRESFPKIFHLSMLDTIRVLMPRANESAVRQVWEMGKTREVPYPSALLQTPPNMAEILQDLRQTHKLGIVTNRIRNGIFKDTPLKNVEELFTAVSAFEDTEKHKPEPEPLLLVAQRLGVQPGACVYIGDAQSDILAARAAGMKVIIYAKRPLEQADGNTSDFSKLPELISLLA